MAADVAAAQGVQPPPTPRSARAAEIEVAAWRVLEAEGPEALTMRRVADELRIKAPSLYKHFPDKAALEAALVERSLALMGAALHVAVAARGRRGPVARLLAEYRRVALEHPHPYRLATAGELPRDELAPGLEEWAGEPFFRVTGDPHRAQALWAFAHGMVILELDDRFPADSGLEDTWRAGALAFKS
ncbi:MAG: TetR/AcrR family transcriptional regulator [Acidimicrobiales bacterium]